MLPLPRLLGRVGLARRAAVMCYASAAPPARQERSSAPPRRSASGRHVQEAGEPERRRSTDSRAPVGGGNSGSPTQRHGSAAFQHAGKRPASSVYGMQSGQRSTQPRAAAMQVTPSAFSASTTSKELGSTSSNSLEDPTFVPRAKGIKDGPWNPKDETLVKAASHEAYLAAQKKKASFDSGYVLLGKTAEELSELAVHLGQPKFRGAQMSDAMLKGAHSIDDIKNIPKDMKEKLKAAGIRTGRSIVHHSVASPDGTRKFLLQLNDGRIVECVGIPLDPSEDSEQRSRLTVCVSSQVGCPMRCTFCATGKGGFARNLLAHEIMDQVMTVQEQFGRRVTNVVFMGMGEPLLNTPTVVSACQLLNTQLGIGARFLTISTVGVPNTLFKLSRAEVKATLAVSIHAPTQALREQIIPSAKAYPLEALMKDIEAFYQATRRRITFEYTLLAGVNDQDIHAEQLAKLLKSYDMESHVNVIPWNPIDESSYERPSRNRAYAFLRVLQAKDIEASLRLTRGLEAAAACGQLRNQHQKVPLDNFAVPT